MLPGHFNRKPIWNLRMFEFSSILPVRMVAPLARMIIKLGLVAGLGLVAVGCAKDNDIDLARYVEETEPADVLYNQGLANLRAGRLTEASRKFAAVDRQHPYSEFARRAQVMSAFTQYRSGAYSEAINSARRYATLYPADSESAYALYIIGLSYHKQIRDVTRDQAEARKTVAAMQELVDRFPDSEYVADAKAKMRFARDQLAGKEMQIGRYYQERREFIASISRFKGVVENYPDTRHVEEALARLTESYLSMGLVNEAQAAASVLGHNFPDSEWYQDSYALLQEGGYRPSDNGSTWLSGVTKLITGS